MIEVRHLNLIKEIAETGSMTKAARKLFLTQPSLSHQLKEIESKLEVQLFLRVNKKMVLTMAGEKILRAAGDILEKLDTVEKEIKGSKRDTQELRVSTQCYTCYHWLPGVMKKFRQENPKIEIDIVTEALSQPIEFLLQGKIDVAITNNNATTNGISFEKLFDDEQVLLVANDHPLAKKKYIVPSDVEDETLIIYKEPVDDDNFMKKVLMPQGVVPDKIIRMQLTEARVELVKAKLGITVLSKWLVRPFLQGNSKIKLIRITKNGFFRTWYIATLSQKRDDPNVREFINTLREQF